MTLFFYRLREEMERLEKPMVLPFVYGLTEKKIVKELHMLKEWNVGVVGCMGVK